MKESEQVCDKIVRTQDCAYNFILHYIYSHTCSLSFKLMFSVDEYQSTSFKKMNTLLSAIFKFCTTKNLLKRFYYLHLILQCTKYEFGINVNKLIKTTLNKSFLLIMYRLQVSKLFSNWLSSIKSRANLKIHSFFWLHACFECHF